MTKPRHDKDAAERVSVEITGVAPSGEGVAHVTREGERRAVLVRQAAPGDRLRVRVDMARRPARGVIETIEEPGPDRVPSPCAYAEACGGCDWMPIAREAQQRLHLLHLRAALPAAGRDVPVAYHLAPQDLGYRTRARLHARASGGRAKVGIFAARTHEPVHVPVCVVLAPALDAARLQLAAVLEGAVGDGEASIALGALRDEARQPVMDLRWSRELPAACFARFEEAVKGGALQGVRVWCGETTRPAVIGDPTPWIAGADGAPLELAPGGFSQAQEAMNRVLAGRVAALAPQGARTVELYAGAGNLTVLLARGAAQLVAVESDEAACEAARRNLRARGLEARVTCADAGAFPIPRAQLVVLDPPRTGARQAAEALVASHVRHVVYVSCDLATLARDLDILAGAYRVRAVEAFEMFPYTSHLESVVVLERGAS